MWSRRETLKALGLAVAMATTPRRALASSERSGDANWARFSETIAIDASGGSSLYWFEDDDPRIAQELDHLRASGLTAMVVTIAPSGRFWLDDAAHERTLDSLGKWKRLIQAHPKALRLVENHRDLVDAKDGRQVGVVFTFQGTEPLGEAVERIDAFHELGVRVIQLTHNRRNLVGDGCMEPGNAGLSQFGRQVVERLNARRVIVDLAHASPRTTAEGIRASSAPVMISHTGCRALADLPRNTSDAALRAMAERGGVAGIIFWPYLRTDTQPMAEDVIRHIEHAIQVCGEDHVGIGTDGPVAPIERSEAFERDNREFIVTMKQDGIFESHRPDALYTFIPDLNVADRFDVLAGMLSARGHSDHRIEKVLGGNMARLMRDVWGA